MYTSWRELADGYSKSLWASFGSPVGAAAVVVLLLLLYAVPPRRRRSLPLAAGAVVLLCGALAAYVIGVAGPGGLRARRPAGGPGPTRWPTRCRS